MTTDGDGDTATASASLDLGGNVKFDDDGPSVTMAVSDNNAITLNTQDADTIGAARQRQRKLCGRLCGDS
ncbi:hypothetical protein [Legionella pneumophila]|uniref:hypothetical protein n=1 Tax=Legionella pneumophila TaxID=446 RepID=UPI000AA57677|nr:hypothetical protein [Legionella pneumophila]